MPARVGVLISGAFAGYRPVLIAGRGVDAGGWFSRLPLRVAGLLLPVALVWTAPLFLASASPARAANEGCSVSGTAADCPDVPEAGIRYTSNVKTITVPGSTPGVVAVDASKIGIELVESGADGSAGISNTFDNTVTIKIDDKDTEVLADSANQPILSNGYYIIKEGDNDFSINGVDYTGDALAEHLATTSDDTGGTVSGSLTVTHRDPYPGNDGGFSTTNAHGISVSSKGGKGGNGGKVTVEVTVDVNSA